MIDILLSTYNGGRFLSEQLDSLINQTESDWRLIVRDDGSMDDTKQILLHYKNILAEKMQLIFNGPNLGVIRSFEDLLKESDSQYIMFCDQDDVWLPDKIEKTFVKMKETEKKHPDVPVLIHTDLKVVDESLNLIKNSLWEYARLKQNLLTKFEYLGVCNGVTGCTMMINALARYVSLPFSENTRMHDSWVALNVTRYDGIVDFIDDQTILYRQHFSNALGADGVHGTWIYVKEKLQHLRETIKKNRSQILLLDELEYGNIMKYIIYKVKYFIQARI